MLTPGFLFCVKEIENLLLEKASMLTYNFTDFNFGYDVHSFAETPILAHRAMFKSYQNLIYR